MYKFYVVPDATLFDSHAALYSTKQLFWDPRAESDAYAIIGPKKKDELNKDSSLEFTILPANVHYNDFHKRKSVVIVYDDDDWIFEGVVNESTVDFYKQRKVTCSSPLSYLNDSIVPPDEKTTSEVADSGDNARYIAVPSARYYSGRPKAEGWAERYVENGYVYFSLTNDTTPDWNKQYYYRDDGAKATKVNASGQSVTKKIPTTETIEAHIDRILDSHNDQVDAFKCIHLGEIPISDASTHDFQAANYRTAWDALKSDILDQYGRYFNVTLGNDKELYLDYVDLDDMVSPNPPVIEFANNMVEMDETDPSNDLFTVLVPIGKDGLTVSGANENSGGDDDDPYIASFGGERRYVVVSRAALRKHGHIIKTQSFNDVESADELYSRAKEYISNNYDFHSEYDVKGIDLHLLGSGTHRIMVGDKCRVLSRWHQVDVRDMYVISMDLDLESPENDSYKIGVPTSDKEANNKRLTSKVAKEASQNRAAQASSSSSSSNMGSILDNYIHVTEWGLELSSRWKNEVEAENQMSKTRFLQDEYHINLAAQKIFGEEQDDINDAGYIVVQPEDYYSTNGLLKVPTEERWYIKNPSTNKYELSTIDNRLWNPTNMTYNGQRIGDGHFYVQRLWTRYSEIDVGQGGIKARVDGNYERSTASSSWIDMNENELLAITGHLHVDEEGKVVIDSGAGAVTGKTIQVPDNRYKVVPKSWYSVNGGQTTSPADRLWYEQNKDSSGKWLGQDKTDKETNSNYYVRSRDTTANLSKTYYYFSNVKEEFLAEYGIYDGGNLNAGVIVGAVNNPQYVPVKAHLRSVSGTNPNQLGWYVYNKDTGEYAITLDTSVDPNTAYYVVDNNLTETYTDIWGEHVVVGKHVNYSGMDPALKQKMEKYIKNKKLDGTITEVASDVVVVNALIAKYIESEEIVANTWIRSDKIYCNGLHVVGTTAGQGHGVYTHSISANEWYYTEFGDDPSSDIELKQNWISHNKGSGDEDENNAFTPTTSGDTVTLTYSTMDGKTHKVSFDKPASIGRAVWSRAANSSDGVLKIYTIGGWSGDPKWTFYHAIVNIPGEYTAEDYKRKGSDFSLPAGGSSGLKTKPVIKARLKLTGDDYDRFGESVAFGHDSSEDSPELAWSRDIYIDASGAYNDALSTVRTRSTSEKGDGETISLGYSGEATIRAQYLKNTETTSYTSLTGIKVSAPSKGSYRTYASDGSTSGTIPLGYSGSVTIYGQRMMDGESSWSSADGITVTAPGSNSPSSSDIDLPSSRIDTYYWEPSGGTKLTDLRGAIREAISNKMWLGFFITCKNAEKFYKIDFS